MSEAITEELTSYNNIKRISDEELERIWQLYLADKTNKELRDQLIVQYIYLTRYVINRIKTTIPPTFSIDDIAGYGIEGLIDAVERYSPLKGARFETYALTRIRGCIFDKIRNQDFLPRNLRSRIKDIKTAIEDLKQKLGRNPTTNEISQSTGLTNTEINDLLAKDATVTSIYEKKSNTDDSLEIIDTIVDENAPLPLDALEEKDTKKELQKALNRLPEREKIVMILYYHENMTLKEIGDAIDISESRACQIHARAIMKLRKILSQSRAERLERSIV